MKAPSLCPILFISAHISKKICRYNAKKLEHDSPLVACRPDTWHVNNTKIANTLCSVKLICNHVIGVITWNRHVGLTAAGQPSHDVGHNVHVYLECATSKCTCRFFDIFAARVGSIYFEPDQVNK